jgi:hypothetical protein
MLPDYFHTRSKYFFIRAHNFFFFFLLDNDVFQIMLCFSIGYFLKGEYFFNHLLNVNPKIAMFREIARTRITCTCETWRFSPDRRSWMLKLKRLFRAIIGRRKLSSLPTDLNRRCANYVESRPGIMMPAVRKPDTLSLQQRLSDRLRILQRCNLALAGIAACGKGRSRVYRGYKREETGA